MAFPLIPIITLVLWLIQLAILAIAFLLYKPKRAEPQHSVTFTEFRMSSVKVGTTIPVGFGKCKTGGLIFEWGDWTTVPHVKTETFGGEQSGGGK